MDNLTAADVAAVTRNDGYDGWGGAGSFIWIFAILALMGGGFWGGNRNGVTEADLCNANSFNDLKGAVRGVSEQIDGMNVGLTKGICELGYTTLGQFNSLERQLADCCCATQRAVDSVKFDLANYAAGTNAAVASMGQKILDKMAADREAALQARVNQLELQQAMCGVIRYPTATTYAAGTPFFGSCGCGSNI